MVKIALLGHSFCGSNYGLGALAFGEVEAIEEACKAINVKYQITCFETVITETNYNDNPNVELQVFNIKNMVGTMRQLKEFDLIIDISGGDSFSDIYGMKLYILQMIYKIAIMKSGVMYVVAPQTIGPFKNILAKKFADLYIKKAQYAFARDEMSRKSLCKKASEKVISTIDLGFMMTAERLEKNEELTVGLNVSGLLYNENRLLKSGNYSTFCEKIIEHLLDMHVNVLLIPHVLSDNMGDRDNDYFVCCKLAEKYNLPKVVRFRNPKEVKKYISQCDFFIGSRMHATIAAVSMGIPTLPLAYSRKFKGVFEMLDYPYAIDIDKGNEDNILSEIDKMLKSREMIQGNLNKNLERIDIQKRAYIDTLSSCILDIELGKIDD